jgi:para-aminobenzoate synthetase component 1
MNTRVFRLTDSHLFTQKALQWAAEQDPCCYLDSHGYSDPYGKFDVWIGVGQLAKWQSSEGQHNWNNLQQFLNQHPSSFIPGYLGYDLKNELEKLSTREENRTGFPDAYFFVPVTQLEIKKDEVCIHSPHPEDIWKEINERPIAFASPVFKGKVKFRMQKKEYLDAFNQIQQRILRGDCYEINLCQEFYAENAYLNPLAAYQALKKLSPTPFSAYFKFGDFYIIGASPERFLSKKRSKLLSQPIKGTAPRSNDPIQDHQNMLQLKTNSKERSENIMIVDLVRNDLTKAAVPGTVRVTEITEVYSFQQVHQLISTIEAQADPKQDQTSIIRHCFPPGSMTGAPKISAMQRIDEVENSRRGVYSGALGYFNAHGDFDFNVVIRSMLYNQKSGYLSFHTGGAITALADGEAEYQECLLKAKAIFGILSDN